MNMNVQVIGKENVLANITMWQKFKFKNKIKEALDLTRLKIEDTARKMAPRDTGALSASIWSKMINDTEAQIGDGVYYGIFQEMGTSRHGASPFLRPAFEAEKKVFENEMKKVLN